MLKQELILLKEYVKEQDVKIKELVNDVGELKAKETFNKYLVALQDINQIDKL
jgi:hypothetical protein